MNGFLIIYISCQGLVFSTLLFMLLNRDFSAPRVADKIRLRRTHPAQTTGLDKCVARSATQSSSNISKPSVIVAKSGEVIS